MISDWQQQCPRPMVQMNPVTQPADGGEGAARSQSNLNLGDERNRRDPKTLVVWGGKGSLTFVALTTSAASATDHLRFREAFRLTWAGLSGQN